MTKCLISEDSDVYKEFDFKEDTLTFEDKFKTWDINKAIRIKNPKARAYILDKIFWENPKHHKSSEFYYRLEGFIKTSIRKYGNEEQCYDEDLPIQIYNKIIEAIDNYYDPEKANIVTFLHKVVEGAVSKSYGINVASLAKLPESVIKRAEEILKTYENKNKNKKQEIVQTSFSFVEEKEDINLKKIKDLDLLNITPIEAMNFLYELKENLK